jgi:hypothetical protein
MQSLELLINSIEPINIDNEFKEMLSAKIAELILTDFPALVQILYRIDISEKKLKEVTSGHSQDDTAKIIAALIIERQLQKMKSREQYRTNSSTSEEERW